jgi:DNA mismatch endonuclease (patch repair protein)
MSKVGPKNSKPELIVRKLLFANGYRYRLHRRDLAGSPDIVFPSRKKIIFVNGCFWHRHEGCKLATTPNTRKEFWNSKFDANVKRDARNIDLLKKSGWKVMIVWQCEVSDVDTLSKDIFKFLDSY